MRSRCHNQTDLLRFFPHLLYFAVNYYVFHVIITVQHILAIMLRKWSVLIQKIWVDERSIDFENNERQRCSNEVGSRLSTANGKALVNQFSAAKSSFATHQLDIARTPYLVGWWCWFAFVSHFPVRIRRRMRWGSPRIRGESKILQILLCCSAAGRPLSFVLIVRCWWRMLDIGHASIHAERATLVCLLRLYQENYRRQRETESTKTLARPTIDSIFQHIFAWNII